MPFRDRYGYDLTTTSQAAADAYVLGIDAILGFDAGAFEALELAVAEDVGFALAHAALGRQLPFVGRTAEGVAHAKRASALAPGTTPREQRHIAALAASAGAPAPVAIQAVRDHVAEFPRDAFVLFQCVGPFSLIAFGGSTDWRIENYELLDPLSGAYGDDWWYLASMAFAHNELYHFGEARRMAERSLELQPRSGNGAHTLSHVFFECGDHASGSAFLEGWLPAYERTANIFHHLGWHHALFELQQGNEGRVMEIYERDLRPGMSDVVPLTTIADNASLLWRCDLMGVARPGASREENRAYSAMSFPRAGVTFADLHCALAYASAGARGDLDRLLAELDAREASRKQPAGPVVGAIARAIRAFTDGDYGAAIALLEPHQDAVVRVGGSNAQREVFEDTLLEAYLRSGQPERAEPVLKARLERRPSARDARLLAAGAVV